MENIIKNPGLQHIAENVFLTIVEKYKTRAVFN